MFLPFFDNLRKAGIPVSLREYLTFLEAMAANLVTYDIEGFYYLDTRKNLVNWPHFGTSGTLTLAL